MLNKFRPSRFTRWIRVEDIEYTKRGGAGRERAKTQHYRYFGHSIEWQLNKCVVTKYLLFPIIRKL